MTATQEQLDRILRYIQTHPNPEIGKVPLEGKVVEEMVQEAKTYRW